MPSNNSYAYYNRFLQCLKKYLEKRGVIKEYSKDIYAAFRLVFDDLIEKAPSACMGVDDWLDKFFVNADGYLCTGMWCENPHCEHHNGGYPYHCSVDKLPSNCEIWKTWRFQWRSYPEKEACQKCRHFKPEEHSRYRTELQEKESNSYKCYCRAKQLPGYCPKTPEGRLKEKAGIPSMMGYMFSGTYKQNGGIHGTDAKPGEIVKVTGKIKPWGNGIHFYKSIDDFKKDRYTDPKEVLEIETPTGEKVFSYERNNGITMYYTRQVKVLKKIQFYENTQTEVSI